VTQRSLEQDLQQLNALLVRMATLAEAAVRDAVAALAARDLARASTVIERDGEIDVLEVEIDTLCIGLLALQQPLAKDLRLITSAMKVTADLERVGDHAVNIAEAVEYIVAAPKFPALAGVDEMAAIAATMLSDALDAFVRGDAALARDVLHRDDRVDALHSANFRVLLTSIAEDVRRIGTGMDYLLVSGNLERIADLATNICEEVVFRVEGRSIKHRGRPAAVSTDAPSGTRDARQD